jgi:integrase
MLRGERHRDRVLSRDEEDRYLAGAAAVGIQIQDAYSRALDGIRARLRGRQPIEPADPFLLRDAATLLLDCALRPEECFRLRWEYIRDGSLNIPFGKTDNVRRTIPLSDRAADLIEARKLTSTSDWVFPAPTKSGHIEKSTPRSLIFRSTQSDILA